MKTPLASIAVLVGLIASIAIPIRADPLPAYRTVPIPWREHGYNAFSSTSLSTQAELDAFLRTAKAKGGWNRFAAFEKALADARIDWRKESLVLLRHTEHSGSIRVVPQAPRQEGRTLTIAVDRKAPEVQTADMAYYACAVVVLKSTIQVVELVVGGKATTSVKVRS